VVTASASEYNEISKTKKWISVTRLLLEVANSAWPENPTELSPALAWIKMMQDRTSVDDIEVGVRKVQTVQVHDLRINDNTVVGGEFNGVLHRDRRYVHCVHFCSRARRHCRGKSRTA
jgi:hypothetical protein